MAQDFLKRKNTTQSLPNLLVQVAVPRFSFRERHIQIIRAFALTKAANEVKTNKFFEDLEQAHGKRQEKIILVMGDFNAKITQPKNSKEDLLQLIMHMENASKEEKDLSSVPLSKNCIV